MFILALGRRKQVGKDEFARAFAGQLIEDMYATLDQSEKSFRLEYGVLENAVRVAGFATALKNDAFSLFSWAGLQPGDYYETAEGQAQRDVPLWMLPCETPRSLWIRVGMFARDIDPEYWIKRLFHESERMGTKVLIIKDVRFQNEVDAIKAISTEHVILNVTNSRVPAPSDVADTQALSQGWQTADLENERDLEEWRSRARDFAATFEGWRTQVLTEMGYV